jgi:hypothetical protein
MCSSPSTSSRHRLPVQISSWPGAGLLSRLATRSAEDLPAGGGWHRLGPTRARGIEQALSLGGEVGPSVYELVDTLAEADDGAGLPGALIHADLTPPNAVPRGD